MKAKGRKQAKNVGDNIRAGNADWSFGGDTPSRFLEHARRSIPFYDEGHDLVVKISDYFIKPDSVCYDLGSSTGELLRQLADRHPTKKKARWIGVDQEKAMVKCAKAGTPQKNVKFIVGNMLDMELAQSDLIICYYSMQFVPPKARQDLFNKIYASLHWGGAFVMFEKVRGPDARFQDILTSLYTEYKLSHQYSAGEIIAKSRSLKGILEPFSSKGNLDLFKRAGFVDVTSIMKYICFEGFLAIK